jgi:hypothetical protein
MAIRFVTKLPVLACRINFLWRLSVVKSYKLAVVAPLSRQMPFASLASSYWMIIVWSVA